jgi:Ferritin-like domain
MRDPSRRRFLEVAGGAAALGALSTFAAGCGDDEDEGERPTAAGAGGDLGSLNYVLRLEYIELDFYDAVIDSRVLNGRELDLVKRIRQNEEEHVEALRAAARKLGTPGGRPSTTFEATIAGGRAKVLRTAADIENLGAAAYLGEAGSIENREILATTLAIHSVEGRHAAVLNRIVGRPFLPDGALATPLTRSDVLRRVEPFLAT